MNKNIKNVAWNTVGTFSYTIAQWILSVLVVYLGSYKMAGYLSLAMTTSSTFSAVSLFGMRNYQISDVNGEFSSNTYVSSRVVTSLIGFVACAVGAFFGNSLYQTLCIIVFMLIRTAEALVDVYYGEFQRLDRYDLIGRSYIIRGISTIVFFVVGMTFWHNLLFSIILIATANFLIVILSDCRRLHNLEGYAISLKDRQIIPLLKQCFPIVVYGFLLSSQSMIAKYAVQRAYGTDQLGIYSSIASPTLAVQVFASVVFTPFLPRLADCYSQKKYDDFLRGMRKTYLAFMALVIVVIAGAELLGHWGLKLLYGAGILESYYLFMPLIWCTIFTGIVWIMCTVIIAIRKINWMLGGMIIDTIVCYVGVYPFVGRFGMNGASYIQILTYAAFALYMILLCECSVRKQKHSERKA